VNFQFLKHKDNHSKERTSIVLYLRGKRKNWCNHNACSTFNYWVITQIMTQIQIPNNKMKSEYKIYYLIDSSKREGMKMKLLLYKVIWSRKKKRETFPNCRQQREGASWEICSFPFLNSQISPVVERFILAWDPPKKLPSLLVSLLNSSKQKKCLISLLAISIFFISLSLVNLSKQTEKESSYYKSNQITNYNNK
jgi:hypothetical protein